MPNQRILGSISGFPILAAARIVCNMLVILGFLLRGLPAGGPWRLSDISRFSTVRAHVLFSDVHVFMHEYVF